VAPFLTLRKPPGRKGLELVLKEFVLKRGREKGRERGRLGLGERERETRREAQGGAGGGAERLGERDSETPTPGLLCELQVEPCKYAPV
jgi:hypothetical protein